MSCSYFWRLLMPIIRDHLVEESAAWAGDRIVCVGDYSTGVPGNCKDAVPSVVDQQFREDDDLDNDSDDEPFLSNPLYYMTGDSCPSSVSLEQSIARVWGKDSDENWKLFLRLSDKTLRRHHTSGRQPGILRNLDTKEFVRDEALAEHFPTASLGEVIILHTRWTSPEAQAQRRHPWYTSDTDEIGDWTGNRFDIVHPDDFGMREGWVDVSDAAVEAVGHELEVFDDAENRAWME